MIYLDEAILTRWNAKGPPIPKVILSTGEPAGGIWRGGQVPESVVLATSTNPYCIWTDVSDSTVVRSSKTRTQNALVQFQVVATDDITCGTLCEAIELAFLNSNQATSNPLSLSGIGPGTDTVISCLVMSPYVIEQAGDTVWTGTQTLSIQYARAAGLRPA